MANQVQINPQALIEVLRQQRDAAQNESALRGARILELEQGVVALQKKIKELTAEKESKDVQADPRVEGSV